MSVKIKFKNPTASLYGVLNYSKPTLLVSYRIDNGRIRRPLADLTRDQLEAIIRRIVKEIKIVEVSE